MTDLHPDHFALFGLPARFALDEAALEQAYRRVQGQVHPDRFAAAGATEKRVAMQWATRANEAMRTLRSPAARAAYLCERNGCPIGAESNTAMPPEFLMQQMQWREELDQARTKAHPDAAMALANEVEGRRAQTLAVVARAIDEQRDFAAAARAVRELLFIDKLRAEIAAVLAAAFAADSAAPEH